MPSVFLLGRSSGQLGDLPLGDGALSAVSPDVNTVFLPTSASTTDDFYKGMALIVTNGPAGLALDDVFEISKYVGATRRATVTPALSSPLSTSHTVVVGIATRGRNVAHLSKEYLGVASQTGSYRLVLYTGDSPPKRIETSAISLGYLGHSRGVILNPTAEMGETKVFDLIPVMARLAKVAIAVAATAGTSGVYLGMGIADRRN